MVDEDELRRAGKCWESIHDILSYNPQQWYITRPENFASLIALDRGSLINNPCREFLVMQREAAAKGLSRSDVPLCYDIRGLIGNKSWHREEAAGTAWEPRDSGHGISLNDNPSSFVHRTTRMERKDRGHYARMNPSSYSYASAPPCWIIIGLISPAPWPRRNVLYSMSMRSRHSYSHTSKNIDRIVSHKAKIPVIIKTSEIIISNLNKSKFWKSLATFMENRRKFPLSHGQINI